MERNTVTLWISGSIPFIRGLFYDEHWQRYYELLHLNVNGGIEEYLKSRDLHQVFARVRCLSGGINVQNFELGGSGCEVAIHFNTSRPSKTSTISWRYVFVILRSLIGDSSVN